MNAPQLSPVSAAATPVPPQSTPTPPAPPSPPGPRRKASYEWIDAPDFEERASTLKSARITLYLTAGLVGALALWAAFGRVDIVVTAQGRLATAGTLAVVQAFETSIVREVTVIDGQTVTAGQIVATLDPTMTEADTTALSERLRDQQAAVERLEAEFAGREYAPATFTAAGRRQQDIVASRLAEYRSNMDTYQKRIDELQSQIDYRRQEEKGLARQADNADQTFRVTKELYDKGLGSKLRHLESEARVGEIALKIMENRGSQASLLEKRGASLGERDAYATKWRRELSEAYEAAIIEREKTQADLAKATLRGRLIQMAAPANGTVLEIAKRPRGSILREAETLMSIVPTDSAMQCEVKIAAKDIAHLRLGTPAKIKLEALPYQQNGFLFGTLIMLSPDTLDPGREGAQGQEATTSDRAAAAAAGGAFYRGKVSIETNALRNLPQGFRLLPGMALSADFAVGERSVAEYIINPVRRALNDSMREP